MEKTYRPIEAKDWDDIKRTMSGLFGMVNLRVDGYRVTLDRRLVSANRMTNLLYVNGYMKGEWLSKDCEERKRFMRPVTRSLFRTRKPDAKMVKELGKRRAEKIMGELFDEKKFTAYMPEWPSIASFKKHLLANNTSIEIEAAS